MGSRPSRLVRAAALAAALLAGGCASARGGAGAVPWESWRPEAFARARAEDRLLLVAVEAAWCHWCHVMEAETYGDREVAALLGDHFVAIRVDADASPAVAERYADWGWPATAFLTPDARPILNLRGYRERGEFAALLRRLVADQRAGKDLGSEPPPVPRERPDADLEAALREGRARLDAFHDPREEGWGTPQKYPLDAAVEEGLLRTRLGEGPEGRRRALATLRRERALLDPVWGGMYQYSLEGRWDAPHFEKIAAVQAGALENFTDGWRATGEPAMREAADSLRGYLRRFLTAADGAFFASQDADLGAHEPEAAFVDGHDYYPLGEAARLRLGIPRVDEGVYADANGRLAAALARYAGATGDREALADAARAVDRVVRTHASPGGGFLHGAEGLGRGLLHLEDQVQMGRAFLALAEAGGADAAEAARRLAQAVEVARVMRERLEDPSGGGFFAHGEEPGAPGVFAARRKPFEANARAARFLLAVHRAGGEAGFREAALRTLRVLADPEMVRSRGRFLGDYLVALAEADAPWMRFTVVGPPGDREAAALYATVLALHEPLRIAAREEPGGSYPDPGRPAVFVCDDRTCAAPAFDAAGLAAAAAFVAGRGR